MSIARFKGTVDDTGQTVSVNVPRRRKRQKGWREHVSMVDLDVITRVELTGAEHRVLFNIAARIPQKGGVEARVSVNEIAAGCEMKPQNVSKIMKDLRARNILRTLRVGVHQITPWLLYNGDFDSWNMETDEWPEPVYVRGVDAETGEVR